MPTVRLDKKIARYVEHYKRDKRFGGHGSMMSLVAESIKFFLNKHEQCFTCKFHKDQVVGLELGRQKLALDAIASSKPPTHAGMWIGCPASLLKASQQLGTYCGQSGKQVIEQSILEHITRPSECVGCPFYAEMKKKIEQERRKNEPLTSCNRYN